MKHLAFDIGGTTIRMAEVREDGIGPVAHLHTPQLPEEAIDEIVALAHTAASSGIASIVCGLAAIVREEGSVATATNLPSWDGFPFAKELEKHLAAPVRVINDAELAALGEALYGAGKGMRTVAYLGLGTGVGTACVVDGAIEPHSSDTDARETIITLADGDTLEARAGGKALQERYGAVPEAFPREVWNEITPLLAHSVMTAITLWSPDVVILGGSLMNEESGFRLDEVILAVSALPHVADDLPDIRKSELGETSALHGARAFTAL
jgi:fructokinase